MATIRIQKNKNFSIVSNEILRDKRLSLRARGLLVFCLSLADSWEYSIKGLATATGESEGKISLCLKELEKYGYLTRERTRNAKGQMDGTNYTLWEEPRVAKPQEPNPEKPNVEKPILENPSLDNPIQEKPILENRGQENTKSSNNKYIYNNKPKEELKGSSGSSIEAARAREQTTDGDKVNLFKSGAVAEALVLWQNELGTLSPTLAEKVIDLVQQTGLVAFKKALDYAIERNKRNFSYIRAVAVGIAAGDDWGNKPPERRQNKAVPKNDPIAAAAAVKAMLAARQGRSVNSANGYGS